MIKGNLETIRSRAHDYVIGIVTSQYNENVTGKMRLGALEILNEFGVNYFDVEVPGAVEKVGRAHV